MEISSLTLRTIPVISPRWVARYITQRREDVTQLKGVLPTLFFSTFLSFWILGFSEFSAVAAETFQFLHIIVMWMSSDCSLSLTLIVIPNLSWILIYHFAAAAPLPFGEFIRVS